MKFRILSTLFLATSFILFSCNEDSCDNLSETVVGSWSIDQLTDGSITMNADGTLIDAENVIFNDSLDNAIKTYDINIDTLTLNANNGALTTLVKFTVTSFSCDQLNTTDEVNTFTFKRN